MALHGPIIVVEDDTNDAEIIRDAIKDIGVTNEVKLFPSAHDAYEHLLHTTHRPFFILCDIRMPTIDGLSFRKRICGNEVLKKKSIPFIFFTAIVSQEIVNEAYDMEVQGFYQKARTYEGIKEQLLTICVYWKQCMHPNREL
ncbi:MAG: response regulator [Chitinophagaceae bacterium]|nr:response regulator [Chitinophagaceae bacterium]